MMMKKISALFVMAMMLIPLFVEEPGNLKNTETKESENEDWFLEYCEQTNHENPDCPCADAPEANVTSEDFVQRFADSEHLPENGTFRIILMTSCKTNLIDENGEYNAIWNNPAPWNAFVGGSYERSGELLGDLDWSAVVATPEATIQENTGYGNDAEHPILNGHAEEVFADGQQFYTDGPWNKALGYTDNGGQGSTLQNGIDSFAWTGAHVNGTPHSTYSFSELNATNTTYLMTGYAWFAQLHHNIEWTSRPMEESYRVYALSEPVEFVNGTGIVPIDELNQSNGSGNDADWFLDYCEETNHENPDCPNHGQQVNNNTDDNNGTADNETDSSAHDQWIQYCEETNHENPDCPNHQANQDNESNTTDDNYSFLDYCEETNHENPDCPEHVSQDLDEEDSSGLPGFEFYIALFAILLVVLRQRNVVV